MLESSLRYFGRPDYMPSDSSILPVPLEVAGKEQVTTLREYFQAKAIKGIIKLDVDDHLNDGRTDQPTDGKIFNVIQELQSDGWLIGLSSRRNGPMLREQQTKFGTNGPNDADLGAITDFPHLNWQFVWDETGLIHAAKMRSVITTELIPHLQMQGYDVDFRGIADQEVFDYFRSLERWDNPDKPYGLFLNLRRLCALTAIAFKKSSEGKPRPVLDQTYYSLVEAWIRQKDRDLRGGRESALIVNPKKCAYVLSAGKADKTYPWRCLFTFLGPSFMKGKRFYHLGDGPDDAIRLPRELVKVLVPANVTAEALPRADRISTFSITSGAVDNLLAIQKGEI